MRFSQFQRHAGFSFSDGRKAIADTIENGAGTLAGQTVISAQMKLGSCTGAQRTCRWLLQPGCANSWQPGRVQSFGLTLTPGKVSMEVIAIDQLQCFGKRSGTSPFGDVSPLDERVRTFAMERRRKVLSF